MIIESGNRSGLLQSHRESSKKNQINGVYTRIRWSKIEFQLFGITLGRENFSPIYEDAIKYQTCEEILDLFSIISIVICVGK